MLLATPNHFVRFVSRQKNIIENNIEQQKLTNKKSPQQSWGLPLINNLINGRYEKDFFYSPCGVCGASGVSGAFLALFPILWKCWLRSA